MAEGARYILVTECLQNDFFLNRECRLVLPDQMIRSMLLGKPNYDLDFGSGSWREIPKRALREGPLGLFLERTIASRAGGGRHDYGTLHMINVRDWHEPGDSYDAERRVYGPHCEAGSWGAEYVDGLKDFLDPEGGPTSADARYFEEGSVRVYHVHADSLFDFKPRSGQIGTERKFAPSQLEDVLDVLILGNTRDLEEMSAILRDTPHLEAVEELGRKVDEPKEGRSSARVYVAAIGVYTDIKIKTVLTGIRTRYNLSNIAVSDTFTSSATLERHLSGLDFAKKVLNVEVVHGINDLIRFLGGTKMVKDESSIVSVDSYARYASFFSNQQNVLAYQHEKLQDYLLLTEQRALKVYATINRSNRFLIAWGSVFLFATLVLSVLAAFGWVRWEVPAVTGGLSMAQFVGVFFRSSATDLQRNLTNLAVFKMVLESHSLKTAFARYHLTTPQTLRELQTEEEAAAAAQQIEALRKQVDVIASYDKADFDDLRRLGFNVDDGGGAAAKRQPSNLPPP